MDGGLVRNEFAAAGVLEEDFAERAVGFEAAKDVAAGAVEEVGDGAQDFTLGAFAGAGSSEQENSSIFHDWSRGPGNSAAMVAPALMHHTPEI
jgi:hypothetical protein